MASLNLRLDPAERERWKQAARSSGVSLSEFVRRAVGDRIEGRSPRVFASMVTTELLPELERMLAGARSSPLEVPSSVPAVPQPWDPTCYSADLHRAGSVCNECGGSFRPDPRRA